MRSRSKKKTRESHHDSLWRYPAQIASQWEDASRVDPAIMKFVVRGKWWETLDSCRILLLITREYEHLILSAGVKSGKPHVSYFALPHPSGLVADRLSGVVHVASTRNPNQVFDFLPVAGSMRRLDVKNSGQGDSVLIPIRSRYYPGCLYLHDLALIGGKLHGNSVGQNAIVSLDETGQHRRVWWPRCIESKNGPVFGRNHIQLNSIAAGRTLSASYYTASSEVISRRRPGHRNFPVDKKGRNFLRCNA